MAALKYRWREVRPNLISGLLYRFVRLVGMTLRVKVVDYPADDRCTIFAGWHGRSFVFADHFRRRGTWVIISHSRDGEMQARIFGRLGYRVIRGSTGRGGVRAAVEGIRALREGGTMALTPDGPRGPAGVVQGGTILMAQRSGARIVPVGISARPRRHAESWDRYMIPFPFARALLLFGEPIAVPPDADEAAMEEARLRLEQAMHAIQDEADRRLGHPPLVLGDAARPL